MELQEDVFWESSYSSYAQDEYFTSTSNYKLPQKNEKQEILHNTSNRVTKIYDKSLQHPHFLDLSRRSHVNTFPISTEDWYSNPTLIQTLNFLSTGNESELDTLEDVYGSEKFLNYIMYTNYLNTLSSSYFGNLPLSYSQVLDTFRSNFEENTQSSDNVNLESISSDNLELSLVGDVRSSNLLKLRSTAKNSVVTFNALQKVFRPRFDEGRSNVRFQDLSNTFTKYPFLSEARTPYESLLGKNKESFFATSTYKSSIESNYSLSSKALTGLGVYFSELPFLTSTQSDASRHL